ncbi:unnamed protein product [Arabis nemorensis]|uniref:Uncharacterized protein n=1 Tax=Arabis nemorensis TaxID=586526 RepID=A0A565AYA9_9BRAS|nr:unnamed protein product [Arabis nemorensis]
MMLKRRQETKEDEDLRNFVALIGIIEFVEGEEVSESESNEEHEDDLAESYKEVRETIIRLGQENLALTELQAKRKLSQENVLLMKEKLGLAIKASNLEKELHAEKGISSQLQSQLDLQYKKINMFAGTRKLDKILSHGRTENIHRGLGYTRRNGPEAKNIKFVSAGVSSHRFRRNESTAARKTKSSTIWVKKMDLQSTATRRASASASGLRFQRNMACVSEEQECPGPRFFDSGSSSQMVGTVSNLQNVKKAKGANVTSRDKGDGMPHLKEGVKNICEPGYKE